ncbi:MAG: LysM peptidoglycan-binding domain-containing protein [Victivallales bacterium]|nr:LysM peptidoglycan-binding domain-containing protein [Victivallales bacterium]
MKKHLILCLCFAFSLTAFTQQASPRGGANSANALLQQALSAVAGMQADVNMLRDETTRLKLRVEALEHELAERDQKIARLESLCATQNSQMQTLEKQWSERLAAMESAIAADRVEMQKKLQQLGKDLSNDLAALKKPTTPPDGPAPKTTPSYTGPTRDLKVESGDTVGSIAKMVGCTVQDIVELNNLRSADSIRVGQILKIPAK